MTFATQFDFSVPPGRGRELYSTLTFPRYSAYQSSRRIDHQTEALRRCHPIKRMETLFVILVIILISALVIWEISLRVRLVKLIIKFCKRKWVWIFLLMSFRDVVW